MRLAFLPLDLQHPHLVVVDGSKLVRKLLTGMMSKILPNAVITECENGEQAKAVLLDAAGASAGHRAGSARYGRHRSGRLCARTEHAIVFPDHRGFRLKCRNASQQRSLSQHVTDYFDKTWGMEALASFIKGYIAPEEEVGGEVLYIEDSRVVAAATMRMMKKHGLGVQHVMSVEDALQLIDEALQDGRKLPDIVLSDVYLKGQLTGMDLLKILRQDKAINKKQLPIVVMTGDSDPRNQKQLIQLGANDLVQKPIEERLLITKLLFQLRMGQRGRRLPV